MVYVLSQGIIKKREQRRAENGSVSFCFFPFAYSRKRRVPLEKQRH